MRDMLEVMEMEVKGNIGEQLGQQPESFHSSSETNVNALTAMFSTRTPKVTESLKLTTTMQTHIQQRGEQQAKLMEEGMATI